MLKHISTNSDTNCSLNFEQITNPFTKIKKFSLRELQDAASNINTSKKNQRLKSKSVADKTSHFNSLYSITRNSMLTLSNEVSKELDQNSGSGKTNLFDWKSLKLPNVDRILKITTDKYLLQKRHKCLIGVAINQKIDEIDALQSVGKEEEGLNTRKAMLHAELYELEERLRYSFQKTGRITQKASEVSIEIAEKEDALKRSKHKLSQIKADCIKQEEKLKRLIILTEFLSQFNSDELNTVKEKHNSFSTLVDVDSFQNNLSNANNDVIGTEDTFSKISSANSLINSLQRPNQYNIQKSHGKKNDCECISNSLENELYSEKCCMPEIPFTSPEQMVEVFDDLERNNLTLIENVQNQEEVCELKRREITKLQREFNSKHTKLQAALNREKQYLQIYEEEKTMFENSNQLINMETIDTTCKEGQTLDAGLQTFKEAVKIVFINIFPTQSTKSVPSTLKMLHAIELTLDGMFQEYIKNPYDLLVIAKRTLNEEKRQENRILQRQNQLEAQRRKLNHVMEKSRQPSKKWPGRRIVSRSQPPLMIQKKNSLVTCTRVSIRQEFEYCNMISPS